jgi:hypothetical protein
MGEEGVEASRVRFLSGAAWVVLGGLAFITLPLNLSIQAGRDDAHADLANWNLTSRSSELQRADKA